MLVCFPRKCSWLAIGSVLLAFPPATAVAQDEGAVDWSAGKEEPQPAAAAETGPGAAKAAPDPAATASDAQAAPAAGPAARAPAQPAKGAAVRPPDVQITPAIPVMGMPGFAPAGSGTERHIELSTPPPEEGAAEFDPSSTGLIRTDTFEIPTETGQRASSLQIDQTAYQGVVPGQRDELPTFERFTRARAPYVTWVGFQPVGNGRVFVQLTRQAAFNLTQLRGDEYRLEIQGAHLAFSNVQRHMDTSFFPGNLALVRAERRGRNVQITLKLKKAGHPTVQQSGDYLYVTIP